MAFKLFKKKSSKKASKKVAGEGASPLAAVDDKPIQAAEPEIEQDEAEAPSDASEAASEEVQKEQEPDSWMSKLTNCCV